MDYFDSDDFILHRSELNALLNEIPFVDSPNGWTCKGAFSVGGFEYLGFAESSDILCVISSSGRGLIDLSQNKKIARNDSNDFYLDETFLTTKGFDVLEGETINLAGKYGGSTLPVSNKAQERLVRVSPMYPCEDIIFQPPNENLFAKGRNKNCVRVYRGFLYCFGFSFSGKYFVIADDGGVTYWEMCK